MHEAVSLINKNVYHSVSPGL